MMKLNSKMILATSQEKFEPRTDGYHSQAKVIAHAYKSLMDHLRTTSFDGKVAFAKTGEATKSNKQSAYSARFAAYLGVLSYSNYTSI